MLGYQVNYKNYSANSSFALRKCMKENNVNSGLKKKQMYKIEIIHKFMCWVSTAIITKKISYLLL